MGMLAIAWQWLISNPWRGIAMALLVALGYYYMWRVPRLEGGIASRDTTIAEQKADLAEAKAKVETQNAAVANWEANAKRAAENQKAAMEVANRAMGQAKDRVTRIEKEPVPTPDAECKAAFDLLRKYQQ